jgi:hypothetical protein
MAKVNKKAPPHYLVTVEGNYAYKDADGEKKRADYKFAIPVPLSVTASIPVKKQDPRTGAHFWEDEVKTLRITDYGILSYLIKENRIQNRIRKECNTFISLQKHEITDIKGNTPEVLLPSDPHVLNKSQLTRFIKSNAWPINLTLFSTLKELREAVINYKESPESYEIYETNLKRRGATGKAFTTAQEELEAFYENISQEEPEQSEDEVDPEV